MLAYDHAIILTRDVEATARRLHDRHGLAAVPGGRHEGLGTANWLVPLGADYLELMFIDDEDAAAANPLGQWVQRHTTDGDALGAVMLRTDDLDAVTARLGLQPLPLLRRRSDGAELEWRLAGLEQALGDNPRPVFIECLMAPELHPGRDPAPHAVEPRGMTWIEWAGDPEPLAEWLGPHDLDIRVVAGTAGPLRVGVGTAEGEITIDPRA